MKVIYTADKQELGKKAAAQGASLIREAIQQKGEANIVVATGTSQFEMLNALVQEDINWTHVRGFHLDEYIGISVQHKASFRKYLKERLVDLVPFKEFYFIMGENDPHQECARLSEIIAQTAIDVAFIGIGENGHLAFNDPPADFSITTPYLVVDLDDKCKKQQCFEGWFTKVSEVPDKAISMSVRQILTASHIICSVPGKRKAQTIANTLATAVTPDIPATILKTHNNTRLYLDNDSAAVWRAHESHE